MDTVIISSRQDAQVLVDDMAARYRKNFADATQEFFFKDRSKSKYTLLAQGSGGFHIFETGKNLKASDTVDYIVSLLNE